MVANAQKGILPSLRVAESEYNNEYGQYTDKKKEALGMFDINLGIYKDEKAKEEAIATEKRKQENALIQNQAEFEQKIKQQAQLASDPYTAIQTVMDQYSKLGVPFTQSIATKVSDANAFIKAGGTIGEYVDKMIGDIQKKDEYKAIQAEKLQQKPITVGKDSYIYDQETGTFKSPNDGMV